MSVCGHSCTFMLSEVVLGSFQTAFIYLLIHLFVHILIFRFGVLYFCSRVPKQHLNKHFAGCQTATAHAQLQQTDHLTSANIMASDSW